VLYSIFMFPKKQIKRLEYCHKFLKNNIDIHAALEKLSTTCVDDLDKIDEIILIDQMLTNKN
jgi:sporadic carbohydrate cluster protein (TIGR04323 family)